jgi:ketosteroid isomerase-like protein
MSQENVEIVRRSFEGFSRGGPEALISSGLWSRELVLDVSQAGIPGIGVYRGYDEVRSFFEDDWFRAFPFEEWEVVVEELIDVAEIRWSPCRGSAVGARAAGAGAELELANLVTVRDGQVVRVILFRGREEALEAAGLSE